MSSTNTARGMTKNQPRTTRPTTATTANTRGSSNKLAISSPSSQDPACDEAEAPSHLGSLHPTRRGHPLPGADQGWRWPSLAGLPTPCTRSI